MYFYFWLALYSLVWYFPQPYPPPRRSPFSGMPLTKHVHVKQLRHIPCPVGVISLLEGRPYERALFGDRCSFLRGSLARAHLTNQLSQPDRHLGDFFLSLPCPKHALCLPVIPPPVDDGLWRYSWRCWQWWCMCTTWLSVCSPPWLLIHGILLSMMRLDLDASCSLLEAVPVPIPWNKRPKKPKRYFNRFPILFLRRRPLFPVRSGC